MGSKPPGEGAGDPVDYQKNRKTFHPCCLRLKDSSSAAVTSPLSLVSAGYASIAVGILTAFRPTPVILFALTYHYKNNPVLNFNRLVLYILLFVWLSMVMFVLIVLGIVLAASQRVTKRWALLLHPWGLLLLYLDMFFWLSLTLWMHLQVLEHPDLSIFRGVYHPIVFFAIVYGECIIFGALYYVYATYFIAAELTAIEKFF